MPDWNEASCHVCPYVLRLTLPKKALPRPPKSIWNAFLALFQKDGRLHGAVHVLSGRVTLKPQTLTPSTTQLGFRAYSPPEADRIWLGVYHNKIPIYPMFYLFKGTISLRDVFAVSVCCMRRAQKLTSKVNRYTSRPSMATQKSCERWCRLVTMPRLLDHSTTRTSIHSIQYNVILFQKHPDMDPDPTVNPEP